MDPMTIGLVARGVVGVAVYVGGREQLKKGDVLIHIEAERERLAESLEEGPKDLPNHPLHGHHSLVFDHGTTATPFSCVACSKDGTGKHYSCKSCDFNLHQACAVSDVRMTGLTTEKTEIVKFVHDHPLSLLNESSEYTCSHCNNKSNTKDIYYCHPCKIYFDLMCATHPNRILSFLHPQHELQLKTKAQFKKCSVCRNDGESNARVYRCKECEFYVHPVCAARNQYIQHSLHGDHTLVFVAIANDKSGVTCKACNKKCKHWCYSCPSCENVYFHPECIDDGSATGGSSSMGQLAQDMTKSLVRELSSGIYKALDLNL